MENKKLESYKLKIKTLPISSRGPSGWQIRSREQARSRERLEVDWYIVVNKIVELGGVICLTKRELDSEYYLRSEYLKIKLPPGKLSEANEISEVESIV